MKPRQLLKQFEAIPNLIRVELLFCQMLYSAKHAQVLLDDWRAFYNARRPHSSLGYRTPDEFAEQARGRPADPLCGDNTANVPVSPSPGRAGKADVVPLT